MECFSYDPATGTLKWKNRPLHHFKNKHGMNSFNVRHAGGDAGWRVWRRGGRPHHIRVELRICDGSSVSLTAHRIALTIYGSDIGCLDGDHRNGDPFDNRISNLRPASKIESARNRGEFTRNGKSRQLPKGVTKTKYGRFMAKIGPSGVNYLGTFTTPQEAASAYAVAAAKMYGEFARI